MTEKKVYISENVYKNIVDHLTLHSSTDSWAESCLQQLEEETKIKDYPYGEIEGWLINDCVKISSLTEDDGGSWLKVRLQLIDDVMCFEVKSIDQFGYEQTLKKVLKIIPKLREYHALRLEVADGSYSKAEFKNLSNKIAELEVSFINPFVRINHFRNLEVPYWFENFAIAHP